ncbi:MAG: ABC transporter substrate-binding protein [Desulfovibrionaceae bacterium]
MRRALSALARTVLTVCLVCLLAGLLPAPDARAQKGEVESVTIQLSWKHQFQFAGYYAALEQGYYRQAGLDVTLVEADATHDPITEVSEGRAQYGVAGPELTVAYAQHKPVVILMPIFQHSPIVLITSAAAGAKGIPGLAGATLAIEPGGVLILDYLEQEGLKLSSIHMAPHTYDTEALRAGRIQGMSAYLTDEPFELTRDGFAFATFSPLSVGCDFYGDTLFASHNEFDNHPDRVTRMKQATVRGWAWALEHPEQVVDLILARYTQRHDREHLLYEARMTKRLIDANSTPLGDVDPARWRRMAKVFAGRGLIPADLDLSGLLPPDAKAK